MKWWTLFPFFLTPFEQQAFLNGRKIIMANASSWVNRRSSPEWRPKNSSWRYLLGVLEAILLAAPAIYAIYSTFPSIFPGGPDLSGKQWENICVAKVPMGTDLLLFSFSSWLPCLCLIILLHEQIVEKRKCYLAVGQTVRDGLYILSIGQFASGIAAIGQVSLGIISIGQVGAALFFGIFQLGASLGWVLGMVVAGVSCPLALVSLTIFRFDSTRAFVNIPALDFRTVRSYWYALRRSLLITHMHIHNKFKRKKFPIA